MRLSWNEVRVRAAAFARRWAGASYEKGESQSFWNDFFEVFGVQRRTVATYEVHVQKKLDNSSGFIDLFWPGVLVVEQKSAGRDLDRAFDQAMDYVPALPERDRPRYILVSDFRTFELRDLDERETVRFGLAELPDHVEAFGFVLGVQRRPFRDQDPANIEAAELVGRLHDMLAECGYRGPDLERFLVRIAFCLFADDTGVFDRRDVFLDFLEQRTGEDGADLGPWLAHLFEVLDTPEPDRQKTLDEDLARFPYVDGDLFGGLLTTPSFDSAMREALLDACRFDWSAISPAIFGALFQSVMDPAERRAQGAHYTTEKNILKVIEPLFMDDLRDEFARLKRRRDSRRVSALRRFQERLGQMTFFDPACGCGNFLVIAYRELRLLELDVIREVRKADGANLEFDVTALSLVDVNQFYGVEISEFPVRIAETAMWMMDHIMNNRLSLEFGETYARIPLKTAPHILHGDALDIDWADFLPPENCSFVFGNPPFVGAKMQSAAQRAQVRNLAAAGNGNGGGTLDYVAAWFVKAGRYIGSGDARIGFVATSSITQGEQAGQLWPILFDRCKLEISFAHATFAWGSDARGKAHVHVVILGLDRRERVRPRRQKRLFAYPDVDGDPEESRHAAISPYLFDAGGLIDPHLTVRSEHRPINGMAQLIIGSKPIDGGRYIFDAEERAAFLEAEPGAEPFLRPYVGAREYLHGQKRWILALQEASPATLAKLPLVRERIAAVRSFRRTSASRPTAELADYPAKYHVEVFPDSAFLAIPKTSSENREYLPIGWLEPPALPSDSLLILPDATLADFALLTSAMHMAWMRAVMGRLESRYRYSIGVVYNTFPTPPGFANGMAGIAKLEPPARAVLDARAAHPASALVDLYDPVLMPPDLRRAHRTLDRAVDRLYRRNRFASEQERVDHLMALYANLRAPLDCVASPKRRQRRR